MRDRNVAGVAIPMVLGLFILVFPMVSFLFLRSHTALLWLSKNHCQEQATALAEEGETSALQFVSSLPITPTSTGPWNGERRIAEGGAFYHIKITTPPSEVPAPSFGGALYLIAGEGLYMGEDRMVVSLVEVTSSVTLAMVLPYDRGWVVSAPGGGATVTLEDIESMHWARVSAYVKRIRTEKESVPGGSSEFVSMMDARATKLGCPDVEPARQEIKDAMKAAYCVPDP